MELAELATRVANGGDDGLEAREEVNSLLRTEESGRRDVFGAVLAAGARGPSRQGEEALLGLASTAVELLGIRDKGLLTEDEVRSIVAWCQRAADVHVAGSLVGSFLGRAPHPADARTAALGGIITPYDDLLVEGAGDAVDSEDEGEDAAAEEQPAAAEGKEEEDALLRKLAIMCAILGHSCPGIHHHVKFCRRLCLHPSPSVRVAACRLAVRVCDHISNDSAGFTAKRLRKTAERAAEALDKLLAEDSLAEEVRRVLKDLASCHGIGRAARLRLARVAGRVAVSSGMGSGTRRWALEVLGKLAAVASSRLQREPLTVATAADAIIHVLVEESEDPGWDDRSTWNEDLKHCIGLTTDVWDTMCEGATPGQMSLLLHRLSALTQKDDWRARFAGMMLFGMSAEYFAEHMSLEQGLAGMAAHLTHPRERVQYAAAHAINFVVEVQPSLVLQCGRRLLSLLVDLLAASADPERADLHPRVCNVFCILIVSMCAVGDKDEALREQVADQLEPALPAAMDVLARVAKHSSPVAAQDAVSAIAGLALCMQDRMAPYLHLARPLAAKVEDVNAAPTTRRDAVEALSALLASAPEGVEPEVLTHCVQAIVGQLKDDTFAGGAVAEECEVTDHALAACVRVLVAFDAETLDSGSVRRMAAAAVSVIGHPLDVSQRHVDRFAKEEEEEEDDDERYECTEIEAGQHKVKVRYNVMQMKLMGAASNLFGALVDEGYTEAWLEQWDPFFEAMSLQSELPSESLRAEFCKAQLSVAGVVGVGVARGEMDSSRVPGLHRAVAAATKLIQEEEPLVGETSGVLESLADLVGSLAEEAESQTQGRAAPLVCGEAGPDGQALPLIPASALVGWTKAAHRMVANTLEQIAALGQAADEANEEEEGVDEEGDRAEARRELEEADQLFFTIGGSFVDMLDAAFKMMDGVEGCDEEADRLVKLAWGAAGAAMGLVEPLPHSLDSPSNFATCLLCTLAETKRPTARHLLAQIMPHAARLVTEKASADHGSLRQSVAYFAHMPALAAPEAAAPHVPDLFRAVVGSLEQPLSFEARYHHASDNALLSILFFLTDPDHAPLVADAPDGLALRGWRACMAHLPAETDRTEAPRIHLLFAKAATSGNFDGQVQHEGPPPEVARDAHPNLARSNAELCSAAAAGILALAGRDPDMVPDAAIGALRQLVVAEAELDAPM